MRIKDLKEIIILQFLGITLVVIGHAGIVGRGVEHQWYTLLNKFIYSFHMPLFFAISGFLWDIGIQKNGSYPIKSTFKKKVKRLLIPYLLITAVVFPIKALLSNFAYRKSEFDLYSFITGLLFPQNNPVIFFWFLPTLFIIFLLSLIILNKEMPKSNLAIYFVLTFIVSILIQYFVKDDEFNFLGIQRALIYYPYFLLGAYLSKGNFLHNRFFIFGFTLVLLFQISPYENPLSNLLIAIIGILSSFSFASKFQKLTSYSPVMLISNYSFQIYLLSWFPQVFLRIIFYDKQIVNLPYFLEVILSTGAGILFPILVSHLISKFTKLGLLLGISPRPIQST